MYIYFPLLKRYLLQMHVPFLFPLEEASCTCTTREGRGTQKIDTLKQKKVKSSSRTLSRKKFVLIRIYFKHLQFSANLFHILFFLLLRSFKICERANFPFFCSFTKEVI